MYLDLLRDLMQGEALKPPQGYEVIYPVHHSTLVGLAAPEISWDYFRCNSTTKRRHMRRGTRHVGETCLFNGCTAVVGVVLSIPISRFCSYACDALRSKWILPPLWLWR